MTALRFGKKIYRNREAVRKLPSKVKRKAKRVIVVSVLGVAICFSNGKQSDTSDKSSAKL